MKLPMHKNARLRQLAHQAERSATENPTPLALVSNDETRVSLWNSEAEIG